MPTPSDDSHSTAPVGFTPSGFTTSAPSTFASCPPEERREQHAPHEQQVDQSDNLRSSTEARSIGHDAGVDQSATTQLAMERDGQLDSDDAAQSSDRPGKGGHIEDAGVCVDPPSPVESPDASSDSDARVAQSLAQSMSSAAISPGTPPPQYLHFPELEMNRVSKWPMKGKQCNTDCMLLAHLTDIHNIVLASRKQIQRNSTVRSASV